MAERDRGPLGRRSARLLRSLRPLLLTRIPARRPWRPRAGGRGVGVEEGLDSDGRRKPGRALWRRAGKWDGWMENETKGSEAGMGQRGGRGGKERKEEGVGRKGAGRAGGGGGELAKKRRRCGQRNIGRLSKRGTEGFRGGAGWAAPSAGSCSPTPAASHSPALQARPFRNVVSTGQGGSVRRPRRRRARAALYLCRRRRRRRRCGRRP